MMMLLRTAVGFSNLQLSLEQLQLLPVSPSPTSTASALIHVISPSQAGVAMVFDTLPTLILGLPATLGALQTGFGGIVGGLEREVGGVHLPESMPFALALMTLATFAAASGEVWGSTDPNRSEEQVLAFTVSSAECPQLAALA